MTILVVQSVVKEYGSTQDIVVPLTMTMDPTNTNNHLSPSKKKTTTKWMVACILGLTAAAVVSSAMLFVSRMEFSSGLRATRTKEAFLLHRKDGTCVVQSGDWRSNQAEGVDDDNDDDVTSHPYSTCYIDNNVSPGLCWSRSYINGDGDWLPCKPLGYGRGGWFEDPTNGYGYMDNGEHEKINHCGPPCTEFEKT